MTGHLRGIGWFRLGGIVLMAFALAFVFAHPVAAQNKAANAGVDNTKMGPYRALAQLILNASQKGDNATATTLAKILERTWDKSEDYGGDTALSKTSKQAFNEIDKAMDEFVMLFLEKPNAAPDAARVRAAYNNYIEKLKLGD
jgi:hypothetical protein